MSQTDEYPKYASNIVYLTDSEKGLMINYNIIYSILDKMPKKADYYWFVNIQNMDKPFGKEYFVERIDSAPNIIKIHLRLG